MSTTLGTRHLGGGYRIEQVATMGAVDLWLRHDDAGERMKYLTGEQAQAVIAKPALAAEMFADAS